MEKMDYMNIPKEKFRPANNRDMSHDKKLETKPIGYFKDAWLRFRKNKGSVVAFVIIVLLVLFSIFAPMLTPYTVEYNDNKFKHAFPRNEFFYEMGWDFWDGYAEKKGLPEKTFLQDNAIGIETGDLVVKRNEFVKTIDKNGKITYAYRKDTYQQVGCFVETFTKEEYEAIQAYQDEHNVQIIYPTVNKLKDPNKSGMSKDWTEKYPLEAGDANRWYKMIEIPDKNADGTLHKTKKILVPDIYQKDEKGNIVYDENYNPIMLFNEDGSVAYQNDYRVYSGLVAAKAKLTEEVPLLDAEGNQAYDRLGNPQYTKKVQLLTAEGLPVYENGKPVYATKVQLLSAEGMPVYENGEPVYTDYVQMLNAEGKPVYTEAGEPRYVAKDGYYSKMRIEGEGVYEFDYAARMQGDMFEVRVNYYAYYGYYHQEILKDGITKPSFLFGATQSGQDIFTRLGAGARLSFLLAISVSAVNMFIGAIYGAIAGYYGGKLDLIMERFSDILSAIPFMIVISLLKFHMGGQNHLLLLFISFFLTGWIGMAARVRMQFYRFKNQEYVLAARTLGASDARIMFKHIFPNSLGTIITGSILSIPGMIFSESSLSYLGIINLETGNMTSVGNMLSSAKEVLRDYPHIMLPPALFICLLMLSFNLFGNGLRDAFNPSLRGSED